MRKKFYKSERLRDIRGLVRRAAVLYADKIAYKELRSQNKVVEYSFSRLEQDVNAFGSKLLEMGMKGYHIAILGENSYAWVVSYLSVVNGVGVAVPMDKELTDEDIAKLLVKCDADLVICSRTFVSVMEEILPKCPNIKSCIIMDPEKEHPEFLAMEELIEEGRRLIENARREYLDIVIDKEAMCEIIFTSGTTGPNKGVMLSHKNIMAVVYASAYFIKPSEVSFSVLPINHTYECSCHILTGLYSGSTICFNDSLKRVASNLKFFKPGMSVMVPLFLESMHKSIWKDAKKDALEGHLRFGIKYSNFLRKFGLDLRRLIFKPIIDSLGGNLEQIVCGGAPIRAEIVKELTDFGIDIVTGYGITECAPSVASNSRRCKRLGSVGKVSPVCQVRIYNPDENGNGEIQVKGDNVMLGYYKETDKTKLAFTEDGWLKTGDLGHLDKDNFLYICGREKNLIILSNGKNVHPEEIENIIIENLDYVKEVVVFAPDFRDANENCINACVYLDEELLISHGIGDLSEKLNQDIRLLNRSLPVYKRVNNVMIRKSEFKKTTTKKIIRTSILEGSIKSV
jgi:long-chain acyl-CoA synthetase